MDTNRFADAWAGFKGRLWKEEVNTRDFIQNNEKIRYSDHNTVVLRSPGKKRIRRKSFSRSREF